VSDIIARSNACVIVVSGGVVQRVHADDVDVILVDFDNIEAGDNAGRFITHPVSELDESVRAELEKVDIALR